MLVGCAFGEVKQFLQAKQVVARNPTINTNYLMRALVSAIRVSSGSNPVDSMQSGSPAHPDQQL